MHRVDNVWYKSNNEKLNDVEVEIVDPTADGDCMILDVDQGFRGKIVSCDETYAVSNIFLPSPFFCVVICDKGNHTR